MIKRLISAVSVWQSTIYMWTRHLRHIPIYNPLWFIKGKNCVLYINNLNFNRVQLGFGKCRLSFASSSLFSNTMLVFPDVFASGSISYSFYLFPSWSTSKAFSINRHLMLHLLQEKLSPKLVIVNPGCTLASTQSLLKCQAGSLYQINWIGISMIRTKTWFCAGG